MPSMLQDPTVQKAVAEIDDQLLPRLRKLCAFVNQAHELNSLPPPYPEFSDNGTATKEQANGVRFARDEFLGKPFAFAARRILEARKAAGLGPASVEEIHEALRSSGFAFEVHGPDAQKAGVRIALGKNTQTFLRVPNSDLFGLVDWYGARPRKRKQPNGDTDSASPVLDEDEDEAEAAAATAAPETIIPSEDK